MDVCVEQAHLTAAPSHLVAAFNKAFPTAAMADAKVGVRLRTLVTA